MGLSSSALGDAPVAVERRSVPGGLPDAAGHAGVGHARQRLRPRRPDGGPVGGIRVGGTVSLSPSGAFLFMPGAGVCGPACVQVPARTTARPTATRRRSRSSSTASRTPATTRSRWSRTAAPRTITVLSNDSDPDPGADADGHRRRHRGARRRRRSCRAAWRSITRRRPTTSAATASSTPISDGHSGTSTATVTVTVTSVNDAPSFTAGANQSVSRERAGAVGGRLGDRR